jgi:hypothetical protein
MRTDQRGARWLAQEQREIGADGGSQAPARSERQTVAATEPPRYPVSDCMGERALLKEYGLAR